MILKNQSYKTEIINKRCDRTLQSIYEENKKFEIPDLEIQINEMKEFSKKLYS